MPSWFESASRQTGPVPRRARSTVLRNPATDKRKSDLRDALRVLFFNKLPAAKRAAGDSRHAVTASTDAAKLPPRGFWRQSRNNLPPQVRDAERDTPWHVRAYLQCVRAQASFSALVGNVLFATLLSPWQLMWQKGPAQRPADQRF